MFNLRALKLLVTFIGVSALAQDHSSEESQAQITSAHRLSLNVTPAYPHTPASDVVDPAKECTPYYYAPSGQFINNFPPVWTPAKLLANDSEGLAKWASIKSSIPTNIQPKGKITDSTAGVNYDCSVDSDCCEWLFQPRRRG